MKLKLIMAFLLILFLLSAFFYQDYKSKKTKGPEEINVKLKWVHQAQFAGNYIAIEKGFYEDEGIKVNLIPFSFEDPTLKSVADGEATFGITGADELILARARGLPLKAFAVIYKINPVCAYSLKDSGITKPQDFIGKTVGIERASDGTDINVGILYKAMMERLGVNRSKINEVTIGYDAVELMEGKTDVSTGYIINEPHQAMMEGYEVNTILVADYGVNMYADVLFAREDTLENRPELVEAFLRATLKGWDYAIQNENEAVDAVLKYATGSTRIHESYMLEVSIPLIHTGEKWIGWMEKSDWEQAQDILFEQGILENKTVIEDAYTMQFLEIIYKNE